MYIRTSNKNISIKSITRDSIKRGTITYPAFKFEFDTEITTEDIAELSSGNFEILNDDDVVIGTYEGYNTVKSISLVVGRVTTEEEQINELQEALTVSETENANYQTRIEELETENAKLLFNSLTGIEYDSVTEEDETTV